MRYNSLGDRLVANVVFECGCWTWVGTTRRHSGGHRPALSMRVPGAGRAGHPKQYNAARVMLELVRGLAPSPEHEASHTCEGNWLCIRPSHLVWETKRENLARRDAKLRRERVPDVWDRGVVTDVCPF